MTIAEFAKALRKGWLIILATSAAAILLAFASATYSTSVFQATARIYIRVDTGASGLNALESTLYAQNRLRTYALLATSTSVLQGAIDTHRLPVTEKDLANRVRFSSPQNTSLIDISVRANSDLAAAEQANAVATQLVATIGGLEWGHTDLNAIVVDPAEPPSPRIQPLKRRNMLLGAVIGFEAGCAIAVLRGLRSRRQKATPRVSPLKRLRAQIAMASRSLEAEGGLRGVLGYATALAIVLATVRIGIVIALPYDRAASVFSDDAFYYFGVARHIVEGNGSTFNGVDPTNGYHPLWLIVLLPLAAAFHGKLFLVVVALLSGVFYIGSAVLLDRIGRHLDIPRAATTLGAIPLLVIGAAGNFYFSGMETGLAIFSTLAIAYLFVGHDGFRDRALTPKRVWIVGVLVTVVVLARLDYVFPMAGIVVLAVVRWRRRPDRLALTAAIAIPPLLGCGMYVLLNQLMFDTPVPVSGQAKAIGGDGINWPDFLQFASGPLVAGLPTFAGAIALIVVVLGAFSRRTPAGEFAAIVLAGGVAMTAYFAVTSPWALWPWYFTAAPLAIALALPNCVCMLPQSIAARTSALTATAAALAIAMTAYGALDPFSNNSRRAIFALAPTVATRLQAAVHDDAPLAMGDRAGTLGYFLDRPLIQLEGLVESKDYLEALRSGRVHEFLNERHVGYYARADDKNAPATQGCRGYDEPALGSGTKFTITVCESDLVLHVTGSQGEYRIWKYRPELNP